MSVPTVVVKNLQLEVKMKNKTITNPNEELPPWVFCAFGASCKKGSLQLLMSDKGGVRWPLPFPN